LFVEGLKGGKNLDAKTLVIIGGGYAGINLIDRLRKKYRLDTEQKINIILIDKNAYHFRKVKLFKAIVEEDSTNLIIPFDQYNHGDFQFIQGELKEICKDNQILKIFDTTGNIIAVNYDWLVLALGGVLREMDPSLGGTSLSHVKNAKVIRNDLQSYIDLKKRLKVGIVGGGITGIETAVELNHWLKNEYTRNGVPLSNLEVYLIHNNERIGGNLPKAASKRLEKRLKKHGIHIINNTKVKSFIDGKMYDENGFWMEMDYCIWTLGMTSNPCLIDLNLPLTKDGKIEVDSWYYVKNCHNIFAIGDCAHIIDQDLHEIAEMTCKEAISQANRLVTILQAAEHKRLVPGHKNYPMMYCIGLGPEDGFVWAEKWGVHIMLTGYFALKIRDYTWNIASLLD
jgi:NADH:ubiquinone reductase (H+-translocating)